MDASSSRSADGLHCCGARGYSRGFFAWPAWRGPSGWLLAAWSDAGGGDGNSRCGSAGSFGVALGTRRGPAVARGDAPPARISPRIFGYVMNLENRLFTHRDDLLVAMHAALQAEDDARALRAGALTQAAFTSRIHHPETDRPLCLSYARAGGRCGPICCSGGIGAAGQSHRRDEHASFGARIDRLFGPIRTRRLDRGTRLRRLIPQPADQRDDGGRTSAARLRDGVSSAGAWGVSCDSSGA